MKLEDIKEGERVMVNLGSGNRPMSNCINVDRDKSCKPDIIADFDKKLPFKDNSVDYVYTSHVIEHVTDIFHFMYEIWRICKHGAEVHIVAPNFNYAYWSIQPNHVRFIRPAYFESWDPDWTHRGCCKDFKPTMNHSSETKGAEFITFQEGTLNEQKELWFKLHVVKKK
jgi:2-polyprenyl-3-methyl-5-hydroxy-6-metoxy-1,4-benzoquinol methylase